MLSRIGPRSGGCKSKPAANGGCIEAGEDFITAANRETREEVGVDPQLTDADLAVVVQLDSTHDGGARAVYTYVATTWTGDPAIKEPELCSAIAWFPIEAHPWAPCRAPWQGSRSSPTIGHSDAYLWSGPGVGRIAARRLSLLQREPRIPMALQSMIAGAAGPSSNIGAQRSPKPNTTAHRSRSG
ncbi:NUDIX domain-containing protein [Nocardia sp. NPDC058058]|uniref:NUDIX domain-containing protein n=1 Tax=Nocardia sp. NPDC058058 TaxID=3346317 RepID=UPI0036D8B3B4